MLFKIIATYIFENCKWCFLQMIIYYKIQVYEVIILLKLQIFNSTAEYFFILRLQEDLIFYSNKVLTPKITCATLLSDKILTTAMGLLG